MNNLFTFFSSQLIMSNFSLMLTIFKQFFIWIVLDDVDLFFSLILVTNYNAVGKETKSAAWLYHLCNQGDDMTVPSLSASFQCKTKEAMDHASQSALDQKLAHTTATWKFLKFLCHSLTTYWNFYSPIPFKVVPFGIDTVIPAGFPWSEALLEVVLHQRLHVFMTFCDTVWISLLLSKRCTLSFNLIFGNRKKSQAASSGE